MEIDQLVKYIDWRSKRYGLISATQCISSNYYNIGNTVVRISDHIKYGAAGIKRFDYCFIIQENGYYVFTATPKLNSNKSSQLYLKIVSFQEAKSFIKALHDYEIQTAKMSRIFSPNGWNTVNTAELAAISWDTFFEENLKDLNTPQLQSMIDKICYMINHGNVPKGDITQKLNYIMSKYNSFSNDERVDFLVEFDKKIR